MSDNNVYGYEFFNERLELRGGDLYWRTSPFTSKVGKMVGKKPRPDGYKIVTFNSNGKEKKFLQHRIVWMLTHGDWPMGEVDHVNGIRHDNQIENLRDVSHLENGRNQKIRITNTSGCSGVGKLGDGWYAKIGCNSTARKSNGRFKYFKNKSDAIAWRKAKEIEYNYHENHGRILGETK